MTLHLIAMVLIVQLFGWTMTFLLTFQRQLNMVVSAYDPAPNIAEVQLGEIQRPLVVLSVDSTPSYLFYMPILPLIWSDRFNFSSLILTVGNASEWESTPLLTFVLDQIAQVASRTDSHHMHIDVSKETQGSLSQTIRIFAPALKALPDQIDLITSDIDILTINRDWLVRDKDVLVTNSECCGAITMHGATHKHFPM